ncbi:acetyl-CoA C-acyltransferase [Pseudomonas songnenensis]|uniref:Acetyl-CoA C-acyltransferase n=1 Tax=Pseudomonas songnenensis TaxID=1176259 RepID=A0A482ULT4_9PSED|nr:acetyl-CoA C-acyltransferase [Pseudomonas songnenensis]MCQ4299555.1 acetyl-CoA C-acyltransferase [Pseudomonas songnenensis]RMH95972.1 acetyl-CoA C-acyltransferase [Pseudomonas songnenensis]RYJ63578.1 acetyl-CoA C-acyltransferase [Pseudomonas songnenensis]
MNDTVALQDVVILSGARTAIGDFGASLSGYSPAELGTFAGRAAIERAGVAAEEIDHCIFGHIITTSPQDAYLARHIALNCGLAEHSAALNVNRLCGSSVQSLISAAQMIQAGASRLALAGGAESMSQGAYLLPKLRFGQRMGDATAVDLTIGILSDPFGSGHMGITAENVAARYRFTREQLDQYACDSHRKAANAMAAGHLTTQIVSVPINKGRATGEFSRDEHVRPETTLEGLQKLRAAFKKDGLVTAGNASPLSDGAAAIVLGSAQEAVRLGLRPRARFLSYAFAGVEPQLMGLGPIPAVQRALTAANLRLADIDIIESNEAFAAQALAVAQSLEFDPDKVNVNGGAIAHGHPVGATGSILTLKALYELERLGKRHALITMCIGGGQGIALILERL